MCSYRRFSFRDDGESPKVARETSAGHKTAGDSGGVFGCVGGGGGGGGSGGGGGGGGGGGDGDEAEDAIIPFSILGADGTRVRELFVYRVTEKKFFKTKNLQKYETVLKKYI